MAREPTLLFLSYPIPKDGVYAGRDIFTITGKVPPSFGVKTVAQLRSKMPHRPISGILSSLALSAGRPS